MNDDFIIGGNFNHSSIDWHILHASSESEELLDLLTVFLYSTSENIHKVIICCALFSHRMSA